MCLSSAYAVPFYSCTLCAASLPLCGRAVCVQTCSSEIVAACPRGVYVACVDLQLYGMKGLKLMMDGIEPNKNRGFGFIEFDNNDDATAAFYYMQKPGFNLDGVAAAAEWAQPLESPVRACACVTPC